MEKQAQVVRSWQQIIRHARTHYVGESQSCMLSHVGLSRQRTSATTKKGSPPAEEASPPLVCDSSRALQTYSNDRVIHICTGKWSIEMCTIVWLVSRVCVGMIGHARTKYVGTCQSLHGLKWPIHSTRIVARTRISSPRAHHASQRLVRVRFHIIVRHARL